MILTKAYLKDPNPFRPSIRRVLVDVDAGMTFVPGWGWMAHIPAAQLVKFPTEPLIVTRDDLWDFNGWWTTNWRNPLWAWCYGNGHSKGAPSHIADDGSIWAW